MGMSIFSAMDYEKPNLNEFYFLRRKGLEEGSFDDMENQRLKELVMGLSKLTQKIVWLRYWQNFREEEIADILGCREEDIRQILEKALGRLRYELVMKRHH